MEYYLVSKSSMIKQTKIRDSGPIADGIIVSDPIL